MQRRSFIRISTGFVVAGLLPLKLQAGEVMSPKRGNPLRKELLNTIRPRVEASLRRKVKFLVSVINVQDDWAFLAVTPLDSNGREIDIASTRYAQEADMMDGLSTFSLLKFSNGHWYEIAHFTGPTDVAYIGWLDDFGVSKALLGLQQP
ncbi:MAG TPA: hypothetical protein ENJ55_03540 [Rhizobiales bacterium]|nr:hypothetical protein [Hyphomicrobiales bacterium]